MAVADGAMAEAIRVSNLAGALLLQMEPPKTLEEVRLEVELASGIPSKLQSLVQGGEILDGGELTSGCELICVTDERPLYTWDWKGNPDAGHLQIEGSVLKAPSLQTDYVNVVTQEPLRSGVHYFEFVLHMVGDEQWCGVTRSRGAAGKHVSVRRREAEAWTYYCSRRRSREGTIRDGKGALHAHGKAIKAYVESMTLEKKVPGTDPKAGDQFGRLWTYQTCTEFGWYQTCEEGTNCPYTKGYNTIQWALELCQLLFDISPAQVLANIDATNRYYGGSNFPDATKVVFPNGEVDPWHWESNLVSPEPNVDTIFVKGASHCEWMHPEVPGMPMQLILAKEAIQRRIAAWLLESKEVEPKKEEEVKVEKAPKPEPVVQPRPEKSEEHSHKQHLQQQHAERKRKMSKFLLQTESDVVSHLQLQEL